VRNGIVLIVVLASCSSSSPVTTTDEERAVQRAFESWRSDVIRGKVERIYRAMSSLMISEWLYQRLNESADPVMRKHRSSLYGSPSDDLDLWWISNKSRNLDRPSSLPRSVLDSPWLEQCFTDYFVPLRERLKAEFEKLEVSAVYVDALGATVVVRNKFVQGSDRYVMVYEGGWKVDHHKEPDAQLQK
jgi:hypothetical protein